MWLLKLDASLGQSCTRHCTVHCPAHRVFRISAVIAATEQATTGDTCCQTMTLLPAVPGERAEKQALHCHLLSPRLYSCHLLLSLSRQRCHYHDSRACQCVSVRVTPCQCVSSRVRRVTCGICPRPPRHAPRCDTRSDIPGVLMFPCQPIQAHEPRRVGPGTTHSYTRCDIWR